MARRNCKGTYQSDPIRVTRDPETILVTENFNPMLLSKIELSAALGKNPKIISDWVVAGCPHDRDGKKYVFDLPEVWKWREGYLRKSPPKSENDMAAQKTRLTKAQADKTEIEAAVASGKFVAVEDVKETWGNVISVVRTRLLSIPSRAAPLVAVVSTPQETEKIVKTMLYEALTDLSESDLVVKEKD
jgi:phage terminase Nu1 subunit (DNA packaging protein)